MTQPVHDRLIAVLDVFIDEYGGRIRFRGILTALLIHRMTLAGTGISASEVRKVSGAPLETIRRNFAPHVDKGNLITVPDPDDDRVVRYKSTDSERHQLTARRMAGRLLAIQPSEIQEAADQRPFGTATYDALIDVLQAFADVFDDGVRIRGIKMAVIILQASYSGEGITPSQIARRSGGALETVRRSIQEHVEMGILRTEEDPEDHRAYRVFYKDPESVTRHLDRIAQSLDQVDWAAFNLNDD